MDYLDLVNIVGVYKKEDMISKFCNCYKKNKINGLYYFEYSSVTNTTAIIKPSHEVHHESTSFLLEKKYISESINTVLSTGRDLKKFLDFLSIWDINLELENVDLKVVLLGFITHLRVVNKYKPRRAIYWSFLEKIPLHESAKDYPKIRNISFDNNRVITKAGFEVYSVETIAKILSTALNYLIFLQKRTIKYNNLNFNTIPLRNKRGSNTFLSGTLGNIQQFSFDIVTLLQMSRIETKSINYNIKPIEDEVFTKEDINIFFNGINENETQNKLLFTLLKCFGLRRAELANLKINSSILPNDFYNWDFNDASDYLKENLKGDIEFSKFNFWVCSVIYRPNKNHNKQNKTRNRKVRLLRSFMSNEEFVGLLVSYLQERQFMIYNSGVDEHGYLFISYSNRSKCQPITGATVLRRYYSIINRLPQKARFKLFSPHTFRHYFATYLIRDKEIDINDVSFLLGHADVQTTRKIYLHYLIERGNEGHKSSSQAEDILSVFKGEY